MIESKAFAITLQQIKHRVMVENKPGLVIIDGSSGYGKTTGAVQCLEMYKQAPIDYEKQYAPGGHEFQRKLEICMDKGLHEILYDEASDYNRRRAMTNFVIGLNRLWDTYRGYQILPFITLPLFKELDDTMFTKKIPRVLIHFFQKTNKCAYAKVYSLPKMLKLLQIMKRLERKCASPLFAYRMVEPNYIVQFKNLAPDREKQLADISMDAKRKINQQLADPNGEIEGKMSSMQVCRELNLTLGKLSRMVHKHELKPFYTGKSTYYDDALVTKMKLILKEERDALKN